MSAKDKLSAAKGTLSTAWKKRLTPKGQLGIGAAKAGGFIALGAIVAGPLGIVVGVVGATSTALLAADDYLIAKTGRELFGGKGSNGWGWTDIGNGIKHAPGKAAHKASSTTKNLVGKIPGL